MWVVNTVMEPTTLKDMAERRFDHDLYRKNLKERVEGQLTIAYNGGLFKSTPELIAFLYSWDEDDLVLQDLHSRPIPVKRVDLLGKLKEAYQFAMNAWKVDYEQASTIRKGKHV